MTGTVPRSLSLAGRVAFVTGAGSGLGRASARILAGAGAVVHCADLDGGHAAETAALIAADGGTAEAVRLDVTERDAVETAISAAAADLGRLDVLCAIAGVPGDLTTVDELDEDSFDRIFRVHFKGALYGCQAALKVMIPARAGSIITTASSAIDLAVPTVASYAVSKAAVTMLTKTLAAEVGQYGVRANVIAPGFVPTPLSMVRHNTDDATRKSYVDAFAGRAPLGRVGDVEDIARQVLYLASDASSFVTGQIMRANGGATMPW